MPELRDLITDIIANPAPHLAALPPVAPPTEGEMHVYQYAVGQEPRAGLTPALLDQARENLWARPDRVYFTNPAIDFWDRPSSSAMITGLDTPAPTPPLPGVADTIRAEFAGLLEEGEPLIPNEMCSRCGAGGPGSPRDVPCVQRRRSTLEPRPMYPPEITDPDPLVFICLPCLASLSRTAPSTYSMRMVPARSARPPEGMSPNMTATGAQIEQQREAAMAFVDRQRRHTELNELFTQQMLMATPFPRYDPAVHVVDDADVAEIVQDAGPAEPPAAPITRMPCGCMRADCERCRPWIRPYMPPAISEFVSQVLPSVELQPHQEQMLDALAGRTEPSYHHADGTAHRRAEPGRCICGYTTIFTTDMEAHLGEQN